MSLPPHLLRRTASFLAEARAAAALASDIADSADRAGGAATAASPGAEPEAAILADIDAIAAEFGQSHERFARSTLARFLSQARSLEARRRAPELWARLRPHSPEKRLALVRERSEFQDASLCELLCRESERAAADRPKPALALAELALEIAGLVPGSDGRRRRCQGYARGLPRQRPIPRPDPRSASRSLAEAAGAAGSLPSG